jgi:hypothetical protein
MFSSETANEGEPDIGKRGKEADERFKNRKRNTEK